MTAAPPRTLRALPRLAPTAPLVRELVVVGGGPVGLAAAIEARLAGLRVLVVEPRTGAIDKACGEGLMPGAVAALSRLGVDPAGHPIRGITYSGARGTPRAEHRFSGPPGRGVRRLALQSAMAERARELGVDVLTAKVADVTQDGTSVRLHLARATRDAPSGFVDARWVIAADGLHSPVRRALGVERGGDGRRYAVRQHVALEPWSDQVEVFWGRDLEAYVTPVAPDEVGVAVLGRRGGGLSLSSALEQLPELAQRLAGVETTSSARGAGPLRQRSGAKVVGRVLLAGDAAGYVDALTGEGLMVGMATARAAVETVSAASRCATPTAADAEAARYAGRWARATRSYRWLTASLVTLTRWGWGRTVVVALAAAAPAVFGAAVEQVGRTADA